MKTGTWIAVALTAPLAAQSTSRTSLSSGGAPGNLGSFSPSISADGRCVAFYGVASNLVPGDTNGAVDIFVRDRVAGTTERVSVDSNGVEGNAHGHRAMISGDGRFVVFSSYATNLVAGDTNGEMDLFVRDRVNGTTERASVSSTGAQANGDNLSPGFSISADGRYVAFASFATNLVPGDTNGSVDVFVRDRVNGTTDRVSLGPGGVQANGSSAPGRISADGRYVAFSTFASNLVPGDTNGIEDVYVRDRLNGTTDRVSVDTGGGSGNHRSHYPEISEDGRYVAFHSYASDLVAGDTQGWADVFVRDLLTGTTERVSVHSDGTQGTGDSEWSAISADGRFVAYQSYAPDLVPGDTNGFPDVFVRDREPSSMTSLCDPGAGGVIACPCSNPPSGPGRGCDNSSATGGASLSAVGAPFLTSDSLIFTTSGEKPTALSILAQWIGPNVSGVVFGMGVRCTSGTFKRLFNKSAVAGSITVPDFGAGDPTISARSAAKGDTILAGQSRWYVVYYRDTTVLGGCPATSNFNSTQTGRVTWRP